MSAANNEKPEEKVEEDKSLPTLEEVTTALQLAEEELVKFQELQGQALKLQTSIKKTSLKLKKEISMLKLDTHSKDSMQSRLLKLRDAIPETRSFFCRILLGRVNLKVWK